ncbi:MAG: TdeIII family type II restriction endonuclease [bacterium]|nr:TdeIII family type II restriction endonuclease [bacterium]
MDNKLREEIKQNLKQSLRKYVTNFSCDNIQPLDLLIPKERKIRSVVGGLETSMGTTVWQPIAKTLAKNNGFKVIEGKILKPDPFPKELATELATITTLRENKGTWISVQECAKRLKKICEHLSKIGIQYIAPAPGTGVDIYFSKEGTEYAYDIKTVQPNLGSIKSFNKQILEWYAYRIFKDPEVTIECKIAYPYNPYHDDFWIHPPNNQGVLEPGVDAVVENQFWDFISGLNNTYQQITSIFLELNKEGFGKELSELIKKIKP